MPGKLIAWYVRGHRELPWRATRDPYRIWLSETMLQQTRVETVIPYYERFLERFPDLEALASADEEDVLREWAGLGYYSRARNLQRAAAMVVRDHGGRVPRGADALRALPGVGAYTVGAIRSLAFGERAALVDGNVRRVLSRLLAAPRLGEAELWRIADDLVPSERPDLFNQALMELGATVCAPRTPRCAVCPLESECAARAAGTPESFPARGTKRPPVAIAALAGLLQRRGERGAVLVVRRPSRGLLGGLFELPSVEGDSRAALVRTLAERTGLTARAGASLGQVRHFFTHRTLTLDVVRLHRTGGRLRRSADASVRWCRLDALDSLPVSTLARKTIALAHHSGRPSPQNAAARTPCVP